MCGVVAVIDADARSDLDPMLARLRHRGPDDQGRHGSGRVDLGHTRLAIIDPEGGRQPLVHDSVSAVANGEIYNHGALRDGLDTSLGSGSDSEVLLPLFRAHGSGLVEHLDGMFAFVVTDGEQVVAARDPLGIKPLYRAERGRSVAFASEIKALMDQHWTTIEAVPAGHLWSDGELRRYYELPDARTGGAVDTPAIEHWTGALREALDRAVQKRLMADVPLGAFLSGGLDSSIIAALAARHLPELNTFALGFEGSADLEAARLVSRHLGTRHHEIVVTEDEAADVLAETIYHLESYDQDLVRSALPTYLVSQFAARELKVVLTGEGADELFAGYRYHGDYADVPDVLQRELRRSLGAMQDSNLQRVDRMSMAHGLEARVPFLDTEVIDLAMAIPAELKLRVGAGGPPVEKWILRRAFEDLLPPEIVWRTKSQFDEGSGTADRLASMASQAVRDRDWRRWAGPDSAVRLRSVEEAWYFDHLRTDFADYETLSRNMTVWSDDRLPPNADDA